MESRLDWKGLKLSALLAELSLRLICVDPLIFFFFFLMYFYLGNGNF